MKKRVAAFVLAVLMLVTMVPVTAVGADTSIYEPYAKIEYSYSTRVTCGTIRYISQVTSGLHYNSSYWPSGAFGKYSSPGDECGTASLSMALSYIGINKTPKDILEPNGGVTYWTGWGATYSTPSFSTAISNYLSGKGKYSPPVIHLPGYSDRGHFVVIVGRISSNSYQILDPWECSVDTISINGTTANYVKDGASKTDRIDQVHQWYNPNAAIDYASRCDPIPTYCNVKTKAYTTLKSQPCSKATDPSSTDIETLNPGTPLVAIGILKNTAGNYWYKVNYFGQICYLYSGDTEFVSAIDDVTLSGEVSPPNISVGSTFSIGGTISSAYCQISATGYIFPSNVDASAGNEIYKGSAAGPNIQLRNSAIDNALLFNYLPQGYYRYFVQVEARHFYCNDGVTLKDKPSYITVINKVFTVGSPSHTHSYTLKSDDNYHWSQCSCGDIINKAAHYYDSWHTTKEPTCTEPGSRWRKCPGCYHEQTEAIPATGHDYYDTVTYPTCTQQGYIDHSCIRCGSSYKDSYTAALGHNYKNGVCTRCGEKDPSVITGSCGDNLTWTLQDGTLTISGTGAMDDYEYGTAPWDEMVSSIVKVVIDENVTSIGHYAFGKCTRLSSITIPESVISIGGYAFWHCNSLAEISIPKSVTSIGNCAFLYCYKLTHYTVDKDNPFYSAYNGFIFNKERTELILCPSGYSGTYTIPNGVISIAEFAFGYCSHLTKVTIPESVTSIGDGAFNNCESLVNIVVDSGNSAYCSDTNGVLFNKNKTKLVCCPDGFEGAYTIPVGVKTIAIGAFDNCIGLTGVTIPSSVTSIGAGAFSVCSCLTEVTIPEGMTSIAEDAFYNCPSLTSVTIPESVTSIGTYAFGNCPALTDIYYGGIQVQWSAVTKGEYAIPEGITIHYTSHNHTYNTTWHSDATSHWHECECGDKSDVAAHTFTDAVTPATPEAQGYTTHTCTFCGYNYKDCYTDYAMPVTIDSGYCGGEGNGENLSWTLDNNGTLTISGEGKMADWGISTGFSPWHDYGKKGIKCVKIEDGITSIGNYGFYECFVLSDISIPTGITSIGESAFSQCYILPSIAIPDSVVTIGKSAFALCWKLASINIPYGVTTIESSTFQDCDALTDITIPISVTAIGKWAFYDCNKLTDIYYDGTEEQWSAIEIGDSAIPTKAAVHYSSHTHSYDATWHSDATNHWHICSCGETENNAPHDFGEWVVVTPATEDSTGLRRRVCQTCEWEETEEIPALVSDIVSGADLNNDGDIDEEDLTILTQHVAKIGPITDAAILTAADINGDGAIDAADLTMLLQYIKTHSSGGTHHAGGGGVEPAQTG